MDSANGMHVFRALPAPGDWRLSFGRREGDKGERTEPDRLELARFVATFGIKLGEKDFALSV